MNYFLNSYTRKQDERIFDEIESGFEDVGDSLSEVGDIAGDIISK